jgi:hypothetical protein
LHPMLEGFSSIEAQFLLLLLLFLLSHMAHMNLLPSFFMCCLQANQEYAFSHHIPNDRQHKFFNFIGRNSFFFVRIFYISRNAQKVNYILNSIKILTQNIFFISSFWYSWHVAYCKIYTLFFCSLLIWVFQSKKLVNEKCKLHSRACLSFLFHFTRIGIHMVGS